MRILQCSTVVAMACLAAAQKNDKDDDKFSIGLGILAPSYRQKVGTGKELGAQIDFNAEGKGFSYTVSQGDPNSGKPYSSIQISRPAPAELPPSSPPPAQYQPPPQYSAPPQQPAAAPAPAAVPRYLTAAPVARHYQPASIAQHHQQQQQQQQAAQLQYQPQQYQPAPSPQQQQQQHLLHQQPQYHPAGPQPQYHQAALPPQYAALPPQYVQQQQQQLQQQQLSAAVQYQPQSRPITYGPAPTQYSVPASSPGVQYASSSYGPSGASSPSAGAAPQYRSSSPPVSAYQGEPNLPQVAPQAFGGSSSAGPQYVPRYQSPPSAAAYPSALAAPHTYNAPSSAGHAATSAAAAGGPPQYVPSIQNVRYQFGSGAEPAFASQLSIFGQQGRRSS